MMKRIGKQTLEFDDAPAVLGYASAVGGKEGDGPLGSGFDKVLRDSYVGTETFEDAESSLQLHAISHALRKSGLRTGEIDALFAGDLLNQCIVSSFAAKQLDIPFLGQYGACSTMAQGLLMAAVFTASGAARRAMCVTSSHFCSAERQYRFPLEYGSVRTPTAQWTVTGAGCCILGNAPEKPVTVRRATPGKIIDLNITDANNMGAAMAPAVGIIGPYPVGYGRLLHHKYKGKEKPAG